MNKLTIALCLASFSAQIVIGGNQVMPKPQNKQELQERILKYTGGEMLIESVGEACFFCPDEQISLHAISEAAKTLTDLLKIHVNCIKQDKEVSVSSASSVLSHSQANVGVFIVNDNSLPISLIAPEARWGVLNIAKLSEENLSAESLKKRIRTEALRVMAIVLGAYGSQYPGTILDALVTSKQIETHDGYPLITDSQISIAYSLPAFGIKQGKKTTYRKACQDGVANIPTNEIQRAIWDEIHAIPEKPIKITYDKDKLKPVVK